MGKCIVCKIVGLLGGIGALNWGLVALFDFNLVAAILGDMTLGAKIVYSLVAIAGIILLIMVFKPCPCVKKGQSPS